MPVSVLLIEGDAQHADAVVRALVGGPLAWQVEVAHSIAQAQALAYAQVDVHGLGGGCHGKNTLLVCTSSVRVERRRSASTGRPK